MNTTDKKSKQKLYTYHVSHQFKDDTSKECNFTSQLYKVGIYFIVNNDPRLQGSMNPSQICSLEKKLKKQFKEGKSQILCLVEVLLFTKMRMGGLKN